MIQILSIALIIFISPLLQAGQEAKCRPYALIEWVSLYLEAEDAPANPMSFEQAEAAMCHDGEYDFSAFFKAYKIVQDKIQFVQKMSKDPRYTAGRVKYYMDLLEDVSSNLIVCAEEAADLRHKGSPVWDKPVLVNQFKKDSEVMRFRIFGNDKSIVKKDTYTLKRWLGRLIYDEGLHLCEVEIVYGE